MRYAVIIYLKVVSTRENWYERIVLLAIIHVSFIIQYMHDISLASSCQGFPGNFCSVKKRLHFKISLEIVLENCRYLEDDTSYISVVRRRAAKLSDRKSLVKGTSVRESLDKYFD